MADKTDAILNETILYDGLQYGGNQKLALMVKNLEI